MYEDVTRRLFGSLEVQMRVAEGGRGPVDLFSRDPPAGREDPRYRRNIGRVQLRLKTSRPAEGLSRIRLVSADVWQAIRGVFALGGAEYLGLSNRKELRGQIWSQRIPTYENITWRFFGSSEVETCVARGTAGHWGSGGVRGT